ncbi:Ig-like domain-containing protein [Mycobacterium sp. AT1]|uniref:Ig-like domain-containing protein n=1 Tax=Mycobacterium sp. AT1 TaxID=1961706 RepID=UPI001150B368|nr:Ig-like domain-containing protein [Mycobacterium sp. AT1]
MVSSANPYEQALSYHLGGAFMAMHALIAQLPLADPLKGMLAGTAYTVRRTLLNQAPTVAPLTLTGASDAPVAGQVSAVDAEGDPISYRLVKGPTAGNLTLNADGSFTYSPGQGFDGVDSFVVMAQDLGLHVNLLDPFRGAGTSAGALFNEGAIKFAFTYTTGANYWSTDAKSALESSAVRLAAYFLVTKPVTLEYDVTGENDTTTSTLASAGSDLISNAPGFWRTVVQNELLSGVDSNGAAADGAINWNFGESWAYGDAVAANQFDFVSTAMHELMHSFGFLSYVGPPGSNTNLEWTLFAGFITTSTGTRVINSRGVWHTAYDPNLTGAGGGLYFDGANAVAAHGGPVPLFTPNPWQEGSSASHLDDATFTGSNQQLMNAITDVGLGVRVLSPIEQGIMRDLGYTVVVPSVLL